MYYGTKFDIFHKAAYNCVKITSKLLEYVITSILWSTSISSQTQDFLLFEILVMQNYFESTHPCSLAQIVNKIATNKY